MMCHDDEAEAIERGIDGAHFFGYSLAHYYVFGDHHPGRTNIWEEFQRSRDERRLRARHHRRRTQGPLGVKILQEGLGSLRGAIGTPDQVRDLCRRYEEAGVDQVIFVLAGRAQPHEHICESLELFAAGGDAGVRRARARRTSARRPSGWPATSRPRSRRRDPPRIADPAYMITPMGSGPPPERGLRRAATAGPTAPGARPSLRRPCRSAARRRSPASCTAPDDRRLERTVGSDPGLRVALQARWRGAFRARQSGRLQRRHPVRAGAGGRRGRSRGSSASTARGRRRDPVARPRRAARSPWTWPTSCAWSAATSTRARRCSTGKLTVEGDFDVLTKLGEMFGEPAP